MVFKKNEQRCIGYGKRKLNRVVMVTFTLRGHYIRIISIRAASRKERSVYNEE